jgi:thymidylate kinase
MVGGRRSKLSKPLYIIISGIDGSGKTTIIEALQKRLEREGLSVFYTWMRYNHIIIKPVHGLCRLVGLSQRQQTSQGRVWRHEFFRCQLFCSLYIFLTWLDTGFAKIKLAWQLKNKDVDVVICDRWVGDILVDLAVDSRREGLLDGKWYRHFTQLLPKRAKQYMIMRNKEKLLACRTENREDPSFAFRLEMYDRFVGKKHKVVIVDNNGAITEAVDHIMDELINT